MHRVHNESVSAVSQVASRHHHDMKTSLLDRGDTRRLTPAAAGGMVLPGLLTMAGCTAGAPDSGFFGDGSRADRVLKGLPSNWEGPDLDLLNRHPVVGWVSDTYSNSRLR